MPIIPKNFPANKSENSIQNEDMPIESPNILGPIIFPSICCIINIIKASHKAFIGSTNKTIIIEGIAPINGPKKGTMFVSPIIKVIKIL